MSKWQELRPAFSVVLAVGTLLCVVFLQMEERRKGYEILHTQREHRKLMQEIREMNMKLAKVTRPEAVQKAAENSLTMRRAQSGQIIHLSGAPQ